MTDIALIKASDIPGLMKLVDDGNSSLEEVTVSEDTKVIAFRPQLARTLGSIEAAIYWQQLAHWQKYARQADEFFYKSAKEIEEETFISEKQQRRCRQQLENMRWIETRKKMANGHPTYHFKVIVRSLNVLIPTGQRPNGIGQKASSITKNTTLESTVAKATDVDFQKLFSELTAILNQPAAKLLPPRLAKLKARLKSWTPDELKAGARGAMNDPFMTGENDAHKKYATIDYILANDVNVEKRMGLKAEPKKEVIF